MLELTGLGIHRSTVLVLTHGLARQGSVNIHGSIDPLPLMLLQRQGMGDTYTSACPPAHSPGGHRSPLKHSFHCKTWEGTEMCEGKIEKSLHLTFRKTTLPIFYHIYLWYNHFYLSQYFYVLKNVVAFKTYIFHFVVFCFPNIF